MNFKITLFLRSEMQNQLHIFAVRLMKTGLEASRVNLLYKYNKLFTMTIN